MDATSRAGTNYTSGAPEFTTGFKMEFVFVDRVFSIAFCRYMYLSFGHYIVYSNYGFWFPI